MPIPILFIAVAAATGTFGVGKTVKAGVDSKKAKDLTKSANSIVEDAKRILTSARNQASSCLQQLGQDKIDVCSGSIMNFIEVFGKIKNVNFKSSAGLNELAKFSVDKNSLIELKQLGTFATSLLGGVAGGAMGGALTAFGAYSAAGSFAIASTGTAISSLSGAAATNATLAFFGGGSLATGGLGMAGGTAVLGGLVAGPALAIMGLIVGAKASKAKDEALSNYAKAEQFADEAEVASELCYSIAQRASMFSSLLKSLDMRFIPLISEMESIIRQKGVDFKNYSKEQQETIAACASLAGAIKAILDTTILTEGGQLTAESGDTYLKIAAAFDNKSYIKEQFALENRPGYVGQISWDQITNVSRILDLSEDSYIVYLHKSYKYGTSYFVITTDAVYFAHTNGVDVDYEKYYYIPFSSIIKCQVVESKGLINGIHISYNEDGKEKGVLFESNEIGDDISQSRERAEHFADLLNSCLI